jgi:hypothetical protein
MTQYNLASFLKNNSIQPSYLFSVEFTVPSFDDKLINSQNYPDDVENIFMQTANLDVLVPDFKVKNVVLPKYLFKKEKYSGSNIDYNFAIMETDGIELKIEIVDNSEANLSKTIDYFIKRIVNGNGYYNMPKDAQFEVITVTSYKSNGEISARYIYHECFFQSCTEFAFDYTTNDHVSSLLTFLCNWYEVDYDTLPERAVSTTPRDTTFDEAPPRRPEEQRRQRF